MLLSQAFVLQGIVGNLSSGKSALVHRYLTGTYVQEESPEGTWAGGPACAAVEGGQLRVAPGCTPSPPAQSLPLISTSDAFVAGGKTPLEGGERGGQLATSPRSTSGCICQVQRRHSWESSTPVMTALLPNLTSKLAPH